MFLRTRDDLKPIWALVEAVAKALLEHETLRYEEAAAVVRNYLRPAQ